MRFSVGQRVRVVSDEYNEAFVGAVGRIREIEEDVDYPYYVQFDQPIDGEKDRPFDEHEIVAVDVTVIEGHAYVLRDFEGFVTDVLIDGQSLNALLVNHKRYRVTIEVLDDPSSASGLKEVDA